MPQTLYNVATLNGTALNHAYALAENVEFDDDGQPIWFDDDGQRVIYQPMRDGEALLATMDMLGVDLMCYEHVTKDKRWLARIRAADTLYEVYGNSPAIAFMRCRVMYAFGPLVELGEKSKTLAEYIADYIAEEKARGNDNASQADVIARAIEAYEGGAR